MQISCQPVFLFCLDDGLFQKFLLIRHILHYFSASQPKCQINRFLWHFLWVTKLSPLKSSFSWIAFLKISMNQTAKSKTKVVQDSVLKLLAKYHQNPKSVNKVIVHLVENFKTLFFFSLWHNWWRLFYTWQQTLPWSYVRRYRSSS